MQIKVNGVTISVENSPVTTGNLAKQESLDSIIASQESAMVDIIRSEEAMDTTIKVYKNFNDKQLLKGQESFGEAAKNVGQSILAFVEKIYHIILQFIQKQVSAMLLKKLEKKINENKDKVNFWYMNKNAFDSYYELAITKGEKEFNALIDSARANSKAHLEDKQNIQSALTKIRDVVVNLTHSALLSGTSGNKKIVGDNIQLDNSTVIKYATDAKSNFNNTMTAMKENQSLLNKYIAALKKDNAANSQDARIVGKFSNLCFKIVFGYYKLLASLTPATDQVANDNANA